MAKGRKLTTSRSERFLGTFSYGQSQVNAATDQSELHEEDVWPVADDLAGTDVYDQQVNEWSSRASTTTSRRQRIHHEERRVVGGLSLAFEETTSSRVVHQFRSNGHDSVATPRAHHMATSAPVNVPDWSKIYRVNSVESMHDSDEGFDERDSEMIPPHEYLAREYARSKKIGGASVCEGVGRTLKGRDMRRVRDAVWSKTGVDG
jgi:hypothetical protein